MASWTSVSKLKMETLNFVYDNLYRLLGDEKDDKTSKNIFETSVHEIIRPMILLPSYGCAPPNQNVYLHPCMVNRLFPKKKMCHFGTSYISFKIIFVVVESVTNDNRWWQKCVSKYSRCGVYILVKLSFSVLKTLIFFTPKNPEV